VGSTGEGGAVQIRVVIVKIVIDDNNFNYQSYDNVSMFNILCHGKL